MRLAPSLAALLTFLSLAMTSSFAADSAPKATPFDQAQALMDSLRAKALPAPKPFGETEYDLFNAMESGVVPVDPAFCERIKLIEITDDLLPVLKQPFERKPGEIIPNTGNLVASKLFALRGNLLCQQGAIAEGQAWLLKPRAMARRAGRDQSLIALMLACALEDIGLHNAALYAEKWSEQDRLAYVKASETLPPLTGLAAAFRQDDSVLPKELSAGTLILELKQLPPAQQAELIKKRFEPWIGFARDQKNYVQRYRFLFTHHSPESWGTLNAKVAEELESLTVEKLEAFAARNAAALKHVEADEAKPDATPTAQDADSKAEALYRTLYCQNIEAIARRLLDLQLRSKLLHVAMRKGLAFDATDLANLTTADGKPLILGKHDGVKAILAPGSDAPFLIIGPVK